MLHQLGKEVAKFAGGFLTLWCPDRGQQLGDGELVEHRCLRRVQLHLSIDDLKRIVVGKLLDEVGFAAMDEAFHQAVHHRIHHGFAPFGNDLGQKRLLEDLAETGMVRRIHHRYRVAEGFPQTVLEGFLVAENFGLGQNLHDRIIAEHHDLRQVAHLDIGNVGELLAIAAFDNGALFAQFVKAGVGVRAISG